MMSTILNTDTILVYQTNHLVYKLVGTLESFLVMLGTIATVIMFGTPVAFWYTEDNISI